MNLRELVAHKVILIRIFLYGLVFVTGFFIVIPLGITQTSFDGNCILYGEVEYVSRKHFKFKFGPDSVCKYNIYLQATLAFLVAVAAASMHTYLLTKTIKDESVDIPPVFSFVEFIFDVICSILTLVSAGTISTGFNKLCSGIVSGRDTHGLQQLTNCASGQKLKFHMFDNSSFHVCISVAEAAVWISFFVWLGLVISMTLTLRQIGIVPTWCQGFVVRFKRNNNT